MASKHFIPRADGQFDNWQGNFSDYAADHREALGISEGDVSKLASLQKAWETDYRAVTAARDAWQSAVAAKEASRSEYIALIRTLATQLRARTSLTDAQRAALGLTLPNANATPDGAPQTAPLFSIDTSQRLQHSVDFFDSETPTRRAKPRGILAAEIRIAIRPAGASPPTDPAAYAFRGIHTRSPATISFEGADGGQTAHYQLRWLNTRGQAGPFSALGSATVTA